MKVYPKILTVIVGMSGLWVNSDCFFMIYFLFKKFYTISTYYVCIGKNYTIIQNGVEEAQNWEFRENRLLTNFLLYLPASGHLWA